jgi:hypothetical protein
MNADFTKITTSEQIARAIMTKAFNEADKLEHDIGTAQRCLVKAFVACPLMAAPRFKWKEISDAINWIDISEEDYQKALTNMVRQKHVRSYQYKDGRRYEINF